MVMWDRIGADKRLKLQKRNKKVTQAWCEESDPWMRGLIEVHSMRIMFDVANASIYYTIHYCEVKNHRCLLCPDEETKLHVINFLPGVELQPEKEIQIYRKMAKHATFVIWAVFSELDMGQWRSHDFWSIMLMMALMWFIRLYLHYCTQWLFLQAISIPIFTFTFYPHTVELTYQHSLMHTREELFMIVVGPMSLNVSMLLMILLRWSCQILFHSFPTILSKFIIALGLWTVLDPLAVFIVDSFLGRLSYSVEKPIADAAKLYWLFIRIEQSGTPGILITLLIYTMILIISCSILYLYLLRIHKESWILDIFQRVTSDEGVCHVPYDMEISNQELSHIVRKAEQWRGINGERKKVGKRTISESILQVQKHLTCY
ncbi:uncharacterized protein LOC142243871 [Anomaloglossus baeobatrachus]|uniref:uncharacterized protein LOC142243871 n=1 Tax=Anomaloglossus baeobatrachus TaxID=238106 RepID=UPI003F50AAEA